MRRTESVWGHAIALVALLAPGLAAGAPPTAPPVQAVIDCRKIDDGVQRLACYDKAVAAMDQAQTSGDLVSIDREQRRAARHQAFGLALPSLSFLNRGEKPEEINHMTDRVAGAYKNGDRKWVIKLEGGAVWRQIDDTEVDRPPHPGSTAEIRTGVLGSFFMKIDGQYSIRVHRDL